MSDSSATSKKVALEKKVSATKVSDTSKASLNLDEIREIAKLIDEHGFTDFEYENDKIRVRLSKQIIQQTGQTAVASPVQSVVSSNQPTELSQKVEADISADEGLHNITSPIVGTFYGSPSPDKPSYVSIGDKVSESTVVCIVEAMKLMNEIQAEVSGEVVKIYVQNGQPIEYGQLLFGIRK
jgi:acetyl-CoA carboxylase biotin carboxyl carrier protein